MNVPKTMKIKQIFNDKKITVIEKTIKNELEKTNPNIKKDFKIATAVGSRGIANIKKIVRVAVDFVKYIILIFI